MDTTLEMYMELLPKFKEFFKFDFMLGLTDGDKFLGFWSSNGMKVPVKPGDILKKEDPMRESFKTGKTIDITLPANIHGFPFRSITAPVKNKQGKIVGTIGFGISLETQQQVKKIKGDILENINNSLNNINNISTSTNNVSQETSDIVKLLSDILVKTEQINTVTREISSISAQTNILAINASIEAARAGEVGKGFSIVAQEMRNLAGISKESSDKIFEMLSKLSSDVNKISSDLENLIKTIKNQQNLTTEVSTNIMNIKKLSESI